CTSLSMNSLGSRSSRRPPRSPRSRRSRSAICPVLEVESALTGGVGQRLDAAVIEIAAAIEHDVLDALFLGALGNQLADRLGRVDVGAGLAALAHRFLDRRGRGERYALHVIDQ